MIPAGVAYAIWSGVGIVLISLVGLIVFNQTLYAPALIGMGLICTGVVVINLFSEAAAHSDIQRGGLASAVHEFREFVMKFILRS